MNKELKYILEEIKKAEKMILDVYKNLDNYTMKGNNKYLAISNSYVIEIEEILSNLEISIEIMLEEENE